MLTVKIAILSSKNFVLMILPEEPEVSDKTPLLAFGVVLGCIIGLQGLCLLLGLVSGVVVGLVSGFVTGLTSVF